MIKVEQQIQAGKKATEPLRGRIVDRSVFAYFSSLGDADFPSQSDLAEARSAACLALKKELFSKEILSAVCSDPLTPSDDRAALELCLDNLAPTLDIPPPQCALELSPKRVALAAAVGAVAGMMLLAPLTRVLLDMRDVGLFVGPPVGAAVLVIAVWYASKSKWLKRILMFALGVAVAVEVWQFLTSGGLFGRLWKKLGGRGSAIKRVFIYITVIFVLVIAKCRPKYNRQEYKVTVKSAVAQWLDGVLLLLIWLSGPSRQIQEKTNLEPTITELGERIQALHQASRENLSVVAEELIQEAKNQSFEGLDGPPHFMRGDKPTSTVFSWNQEHQEKYEAYGEIEVGDDVIVQRDPVIFDGIVRKKGLVRKKTEREVTMSDRNVLAMDFGTVNTYFCKCPGDQVSPVGVDFGKNRDGLATAILYRKDRTALIGDTALEEYGDATSEERKDYILRTQFKPDIVRSEEARKNAVEFLKGVLEEARQQNLALSPTERSVIIGVPSESDDVFRSALTKVAKEAGYGDVRTMDEPKGALLNHVSHKDIPATDALKGVLVVDFGGGTCDFAFMDRGMVRYSWGDMDLGGRLFDDLFFQWFLDENPDAYGRMVENGDEFFVHWNICREMKEKFSQTMTRDRNETFKKAVGEYGRLTGATWEGFVSRAQTYVPSDTFKKHLSETGVEAGKVTGCKSPIDLFEWFRSSLRQGIEENNIKKSDILFVIQAGGSCLWPFVTEITMAELGIDQSRIMRSDRPYAAIAEGLAILPALQVRFEQVQKALRSELPNFTKRKLKPLISRRIETVAGDISESIAAELYDQKLRPILLTFRKEGGSVASLEELLASDAAAFEPRVKELVQEKMSLLSKGLPSAVRELVTEWFTEHGLAPPERAVSVTGGKTRKIEIDTLDISEDMFFNVGDYMVGVTAAIGAMVCGGAGMALIASGPIGWIIGLILGIAVGIAGKEAAKRVHIPALALKVLLTESKLNTTREKLKEDIASKVEGLTSTLEAKLDEQISDLVSREIESLSEINQM